MISQIMPIRGPNLTIISVGCRDGGADSMGTDGVSKIIVFRVPFAYHSRYWVCHCMRNVNANMAESYSCDTCAQHHVVAGFQIEWIAGGPS